MDRALLFSYFPVDQSQTTITYKKKNAGIQQDLYFSILVFFIFWERGAQTLV